ncbi:hypothetical protein TNCV_1299771 [Trichonephila clavipes]|nr:hypothetical protein TNCV_1299771 [Trichonephila clavipes]
MTAVRFSPVATGTSKALRKKEVKIPLDAFGGGTGLELVTCQLRSNTLTTKIQRPLVKGRSCRTISRMNDLGPQGTGAPKCVITPTSRVLIPKKRGSEGISIQGPHRTSYASG